jgi:capsular polysaccharide biosynthesis protein/MinD-like ATPase involved in chromosome partitioning or flagellar assembly
MIERQEIGMSPLYLRDRLVRFWWLLALCAIAGGISGWIGGALLFTQYSSTALVQVDIRTPNPSAGSVPVADRIIRTSAQLAVSDSILSPIASANGMSLAALRGEVSAAPVANSLLMEVTVRDANGNRAATLANAVARAVISDQNQGIAQANSLSLQQYMANVNALGDTLSQLNTELAALGQPPSDQTKAQALQLQIIAAQSQYDVARSTLSQIQTVEAAGANNLRLSSPARASSTPVTSHQIVTAIGGLLLGLACGILLILGGEWLNTRVSSAEAVAQTFGWALLGVERGANSERSQGQRLEQATLLARDLDFLGIERSLRAIALVSARPSARARNLATQLALVCARGGRKTLLVDAHLSDGAQAATFGVNPEPGLSDVILKFTGPGTESKSLLTYLSTPTRNADPHLLVLPSGNTPPNPGRVLASSACKRALAALAELPAEITVYDAPAALLSGENDLGATALDAVVIVVDPKSARRGDLMRLSRSLADLSAKTLGFVFIEGAEMARSQTLSAPAARRAKSSQGNRSRATNSA